MLIDTGAIAQRDAVRADIAVRVAEFERLNGPVMTLPIRCEDKITPYRIACPERKEAARKKATDTRSRQLPLRKRRTPQAKKNAELREEW